PLADRATIANMAPEYGATCGIFPVDAETLRYLRFTGRPDALIRLVEAYTKEQGLFHTPDTQAAAYSETLELDLGSVEPSLARPRRPQDRVPLGKVKESFAAELPRLRGARARALPAVQAATTDPQAAAGRPLEDTGAVPGAPGTARVTLDHTTHELT